MENKILSLIESENYELAIELAIGQGLLDQLKEALIDKYYLMSANWENCWGCAGFRNRIFYFIYLFNDFKKALEARGQYWEIPINSINCFKNLKTLTILDNDPEYFDNWEIPKEIFQLKNLKELNFIDDCGSMTLNAMTEVTPKEIEKLQSLEELGLMLNTWINDEFLLAICQLKNLKVLDLTSAWCADTAFGSSMDEPMDIPKEIGQLENLEKLYLHGNWLTKLPKELGQLKKLKELHLCSFALDNTPKWRINWLREQLPNCNFIIVN